MFKKSHTEMQVPHTPILRKDAHEAIGKTSPILKLSDSNKDLCDSELPTLAKESTEIDVPKE
jgi:hypothetical protein